MGILAFLASIQAMVRGDRTCEKSMPAKDLFHDAVKQALLKEEWVITADPLTIKIEGVKFEIDLAAEKIFAAEKAGRKIAVEVKSLGASHFCKNTWRLEIAATKTKSAYADSIEPA